MEMNKEPVEGAGTGAGTEDLRKKVRIRTIVWWIVTLCIAVALTVTGSDVFRNRPPVPALAWVFGALILLPFVMIGLDALFTAGTLKMYKNNNVAEINRVFREKREEVRKNYKKSLAAVWTVRTSYMARALWLIVSGASVAFISSPVLGYRFFFIGALAGAYMIICGAASIPVYKFKPADSGIGEPVSEDEFPYVYSMARKAAAEAGCVKNVKIIFTSDYNAGISDQGKDAFLLIGAPMMKVMSEKEMYVILLHEFGHCSEGFFEDVRKEERLFNWMGSGGHRINVPEVYYHVLRSVYAFRYMYFSYTVQPVIEAAADDVAIRGSDPDTYASAEIKSSYDFPLEWEKYGYDNPDSDYMWSGDSFPEDYASYVADGIIEAARKRSDIWLENFSREIIANNATHPTLKMRLEAAGIEKMEIHEYGSSAEYEAETVKALAAGGKLAAGNMKSDFERLKKTYYTEPLKTVSEWEQAGRPVDQAGYGDVIDALRALGRASEAEQLCDRAIEILPEHAAPKAMYIKGCTLLSRYDPKGVDLVYKAIELNDNYADEGYRIVIQFCLMTGRQELVEDARSRAIAHEQQSIDVLNKVFTLEKGDVLTAEKLPEGVLEKDIQNIVRIADGTVSAVYLVRKEVADKYASHYVIRFKEGTDMEKRGDVLHGIFMYLDTVSDWQYSLDAYEDAAEAGIERIDGALVWEEKKD